jgi:hypothetical protein
VHNEGAKPTHLGMEKTNGAALRVVRAERIRANQLGQLRGLMDSRRTGGTHFVQDDGNTSARHLPNGFAAGKPASDNVNRAHSFRHFGKLGRSAPGNNLMGINQCPGCSYEDTDDPAKSGVSYLVGERQGTPECSM